MQCGRCDKGVYLSSSHTSFSVKLCPLFVHSATNRRPPAVTNWLQQQRNLIGHSSSWNKTWIEWIGSQLGHQIHLNGWATPPGADPPAGRRALTSPGSAHRCCVASTRHPAAIFTTFTSSIHALATGSAGMFEGTCNAGIFYPPAIPLHALLHTSSQHWACGGACSSNNNSRESHKDVERSNFFYLSSFPREKPKGGGGGSGGDDNNTFYLYSNFQNKVT